LDSTPYYTNLKKFTVPCYTQRKLFLFLCLILGTLKNSVPKAKKNRIIENDVEGLGSDILMFCPIILQG
jgi:hypothetical protein